MSKIVSGKLTVGAVAVNVECGFIPDYVQAISAIGGTEITFEWWKVLYDTVAAAKGKFGFVTSIAPAHVAAATNGIIPYDTSIESVLLPAPDSDGVVMAPSIADYSTTTTYVARDLSAGVEVLGSVVRPTTHNGFVYECIVASGGAAGAEPTSWGTTVGGRTVAGSGDEWICREERIARRGVKGFTLGATICTNGEEWVFRAEKHDRHADMGDADVENPVTFGERMI